MDSIYIPEDIWVSVLSFFETKQLFLSRRVCKLFGSLINSNRIKKVVTISSFEYFGTIIDNLTKLDNIYYVVNDTSEIGYPFINEYYRQIVRLGSYNFPNNFLDLIPQMTNLTFLQLGYFTGIEDDDISTLTNIQSLNLKYIGTITNRIFTCLTNITNLCLDFNENITDEGVSKLTNIRHLNLGDNRMITNGALSCLTNITMLNLYRNNLITHQGISGLTNIKGLDLQSNYKVCDDSVKILTNITYLNLNQNDSITNESLTNLVNLATIELWHNDRVNYRSLSMLSNLVVSKAGIGYLEFV